MIPIEKQTRCPGFRRCPALAVGARRNVQTCQISIQPPHQPHSWLRRIHRAPVHDRHRQETDFLAGTLYFNLGPVCGWVVSREEGGHNWGVGVVIHRKASRETREAANALASGLGDVGLTDDTRQKPEVRTAQEGSQTDRTNFAPDTILLFVGKHP